MRLTWKDGSFTPSIGAAATGVVWLAAVIRYAPEAPAGRRDAVTHEVICQDGAAQR